MGVKSPCPRLVEDSRFNVTDGNVVAQSPTETLLYARMSIDGRSRAIRCVASGMVCKNSGTPGVDNEGSTPLLQVPTGLMLCGGPDTSANAPYCENVTLFAAVSGAKEMGPFCASTVEIAYRFAVPEVLDTIKIFRPSGENAAAVAFGICSTVR